MAFPISDRHSRSSRSSDERGFYLLEFDGETRTDYSNHGHPNTRAAGPDDDGCYGLGYDEDIVRDGAQL